ncbi:membrane protein containing ATP-binding region, ATPase-like domain protein [Candidatus Magnetomorum sp. HK-1]|nr:membrane protein containing ATP-binding region, ATPase-like domain protein [Candidatus Magnetomorum sp. HK-1]
MKNKSSLIQRYIYIILLLIFWTSGLTASFVWSYISENKKTIALARKEALTVFKKDLSYRLWASTHGGVYVPVTEQTPSNKYLSHIPERDIVTPSGKKLTLMNPAYMIRQIMENYSKTYGIKGHITSLKLLNPINKPDEWERNALNSFKKGIEEIFEIRQISGNPYIRLIRPIITKKGCLKCHGHQGYKVGEARGGVSVSVPLESYNKMKKNSIKRLLISHVLIWLFGTIIIFFIALFNIKRIKEKSIADAEIYELNKHLDQKIKETEKAYKELKSTQAQLIHSEKLSVLGEMAAGVAHEMSQPLNIIKILSQLLIASIDEGNASDDNNEEGLKSIIDQVNKMSEIIHHMRVFTRKTQDIVLEMININEIVEDSLKLYRSQLNKYNIKMVKKLNENLPDIKGNPVQIEQILINLFTNARLSMEKSNKTKKELVIRTYEKVDEKIVCLEVEDSGDGIPKDMQDKIFQSFFTTRESDEGTGLGLSIVKQIVDHHDAKIEVESEVGQGALFRILFPL